IRPDGDARLNRLLVANYRGLGLPPGAGLVDLGEVPFSKPQMLRRHLEELVVPEEVQRLFQAQSRSRRQPNRDVRRGRADVRLLLLAANIDPYVPLPLLDADDHALVHLFARLDEGGAALLRARQPEGQRLAGRRRGQRSVPLLPELAEERAVAHADRAHQTRARGEREQRVAEADQAARRNQIFEPHAALLVVGDLEHLPPAPAPRLGPLPEALLAHIHGQVLHRLHALPVDLLHDGFRARDLELVALATHRLDEHRTVQLAPAADRETSGGVHLLDVWAGVGIALF